MKTEPLICGFTFAYAKCLVDSLDVHQSQEQKVCGLNPAGVLCCALEQDACTLKIIVNSQEGVASSQHY